MSLDPLSRLADAVAAGGVVFFGGAGVSTESGIPDFRSEQGLYTARRVYGHSPEILLSHGMLVDDPVTFFRYHTENLVHVEAQPNAAHRVLAALEVRGLVDAVITQNIDGLHQQAGSRVVHELHGSIWRHYCTECDRPYSLAWALDKTHCREGTMMPVCEVCTGMVRPDVVLYGEGLDGAVLGAAARALARARTVIVAGTSLAVYPAAGLVDYASPRLLALINLTPTSLDHRADCVVAGKVGEVLSEVATRLDVAF